MDIELAGKLVGQKLNIWQDFLEKAALRADGDFDRVALIWDEGQLIAAGARSENLLKYIAVAESHRGEDLTAKVLTALRQDAFESGYNHLFLYTKPENRHMFSSLFFYPVAQTDKVLLMENLKSGIGDFLDSLPAAEACTNVGSIVMNCNPFTLGHRYLIEKAASECDMVYVFVLSEDKSRFSAEDRLEMVRRGTADLGNVSVLPTGPYLISSATFPTYFLKDRENAEAIHCLLDIEIFAKYYVPKFSITKRYVGTEPLSRMTSLYNEALRNNLPKYSVEFIEIPRLAKGDTPISASAFREALSRKDIASARKLVPQTTFDYMQAKSLL